MGSPHVMSASDVRPLAVVTGASSGIGLELAHQFAGPSPSARTSPMT
jgi:NADP-dependent 3-hydroxy acid dehydrogenase YdfG